METKISGSIESNQLVQNEKNDINFLKVKVEIKNKDNLLDQIKLLI